MSTLAERIRVILGDDPNIGEIRMFGGLCFMLNGNMLVCSMRDDALLARVGERGMESALKRPGAARMEMGGRYMKAYVVVDGSALEGRALDDWIALATDFVGAMPPKPPKAATKKAAKRKV